MDRNTSFNLELCVLAAFTGEGCFLGSAVRPSFEDAFEHASIEAHRHLVIANQQRDFSRFPYNRIYFFSRNRALAEKILDRERVNHWPSPRIKLQLEYAADFFFIVRTIFDGWNSWHKGPDERLLY